MDDNKSSGGFLENISEGGLPQLIAGPAGKAISRLIGAGVEIPAAWLEQKARAIRDETEARSTVMKSLAERSASLGLEDTALLNRGLDNLLGRAYRDQQNREAVAIETMRVIGEDASEPTGEGPSDDWMNVFEGLAANASSENLRQLFGKVLAGEIRKPGEFSLSTLQLVSIIDSALARIIERVAAHVWDGAIVPREAVGDSIPYDDLLALEDIGFLSLGAGMLHQNKVANESGIIGYRAPGVGLMAEFEPGQKLSLPAYPLSRSGRELVKILSRNPKIAAAAKALWKLDPKRVFVGVPIPFGEGFTLHSPREISKSE